MYLREHTNWEHESCINLLYVLTVSTVLQIAVKVLCQPRLCAKRSWRLATRKSLPGGTRYLPARPPPHQISSTCDVPPPGLFPHPTWLAKGGEFKRRARGYTNQEIQPKEKKTLNSSQRWFRSGSLLSPHVADDMY
jgi:hypothetical protein